MSAKLLIADDTPEIREYLEFVFTRNGFQVHTVNDGLSALEQAADVAPDAILLDVMMPLMNGLETCRHLRADPRTAHLPIIMYSAAAGTEFQQNALAVGADDFLGKTMGHDALLERVRAILSKRAQAGGVGAVSLVTTTLDICTLLAVDLVHLLRYDKESATLTHAATGATIGKEPAQKFLKTIGTGPYLLSSEDLFVTLFNSGRPRLDWPTREIAQQDSGREIAGALAEIGASAASALPAHYEGKVHGLVFFTSPPSSTPSAGQTRALRVVSRYAGMSLSNKEE